MNIPSDSLQCATSRHEVVPWKTVREAQSTFKVESTFMIAYSLVQLQIIKNEFLRGRAQTTWQGDIGCVKKRWVISGKVI